MPLFSGSRSASVRSIVPVRSALICIYGHAIEDLVRFSAVVEADHRDAHRRTLQYPGSIALGEEDIPGLLDPLQDATVCAASYPVGRQ